LDLVIFDKTGTLTRGSPAVSGLVAAPGSTENDLIAHAAAVESNSEHPLAKAIVAEAKRRGVAQLSATSFVALAGRGAKALVEGKAVEIGGPRLLTEAKVTVPPEVERLTTAWASDGKTVLMPSLKANCLEPSPLKMRFGLNPVKPSPNFTGLASGSQ
jgi:Cu2+-exporting ATPase